MEQTPSKITYYQLIRSNVNFRNLWYGQVISQCGDWFISIAIYTLILDMTGSSERVGLFLVVRLLPMFFMGPIAGIIADRYYRKHLMILLDILRGIVVLGFLLVKTADDLWIIYTLTAVQVVLSSIFEPAKTSSIPNITSKSELLAANALSGITWSVMLAFGGMAGGFVTAVAGQQAAIIIDAITYFVSSYFIYQAVIPRQRSMPRRKTLAETLGITDLLDGFRYMIQHPRVLSLLMVKFGNGLSGGAIVIVAIFGQQIFPVGGSAAAGMGILHAGWGIGSAIGPSLARKYIGESKKTLRWSIGPAFLLKALFLILFSFSYRLDWAVLCQICAFAGGSILWIYSTTLLHMEVPDEFRGRVFAAEFALLTFSMALSNYATGFVLDFWNWSPRYTGALLGTILILPAIVWTIIQLFWKDQEE